MGNNLQPFSNPEFGTIRTLEKDNEIWFVGKDVCDILKYQNGSRDINRHVDEEDRIKEMIAQYQNGTLVKTQTILINESGLYSLVLSSKLPTAKKFKRWVTSEVLPSIRKHGGYLTPEKIEEVLLNPDTIIKLATELKEERQKRIEREAQIEADKPKVLFADSVSASKNSISVAEMAKILKQNGVDTGQNRFYQYLRDNNYLVSRKGVDYNCPTQYAMNLGLFEIQKTVINTNHGIETKKTPRVTGKGQLYFVDKFRKVFLNENQRGKVVALDRLCQ